MTTLTIENIFGVGSFRLCAGFPSSIRPNVSSNDHIYEYPLNGCIVVENYSRKERIHFEHVYDDIIVVMLYNAFTNQVLTCSYSGKIILWSPTYQKRLVEQQARIDHVHYGMWTRDGTTIYLCSRFDGTVISLNYDSQHHSLTENWLRHWATPHRDIHPVDVFSSIDPSNKIETSNTYVAGSIGYEFLIGTAMRRHVFAVLQRPQEHVRIHQLNLRDGHLLHDLKLEPAKSTQTFLCGTTETHIDSTTDKEFFAIGLQSGLIFILCVDPLQIHRVITASGSPQAMIWWHSALLTVGYISSIVNLFALDGSLIGSAQGAPTSAVCHLHWGNDEQNCLWIGGYMGLSLIQIERIQPRSPSPVGKVMFTIINSITEESSSSISLNTLLDQTLHQTAGCGVYLEHDQIYSGDLAGNIFQWTLRENQPKRHVTIADSVRCFISENLVGTLSGGIYRIDTGEMIDDWKTSVICAAWNRAKTSCLIGLGDGRLIESQTKSLIALHQDNVEIWSVCWSPDETLCATASEDQTTCVWRIDSEQELIATLRGHTTAVTSVQWKGERIYSCADDRTVRIYDSHSSTYTCLHVLRTPKSLFGWFTLTYLQVDEEKHWIMATTQNGYLVVWKEQEDQDELPILCKKIHFGSLEGFVYDRERSRAVVIGSDCSVTCFRLQ